MLKTLKTQVKTCKLCKTCRVVDPALALEYAFGALNTGKSVGSTTATVVTVDTNSEAGYTILKGANIGDSGVLVVRQVAPYSYFSLSLSLFLFLALFLSLSLSLSLSCARALSLSLSRALSLSSRSGANANRGEFGSADVC